MNDYKDVFKNYIRHILPFFYYSIAEELIETGGGGVGFFADVFDELIKNELNALEASDKLSDFLTIDRKK